MSGTVLKCLTGNSAAHSGRTTHQLRSERNNNVNKTTMNNMVTATNNTYENKQRSTTTEPKTQTNYNETTTLLQKHNTKSNGTKTALTTNSTDSNNTNDNDNDSYSNGDGNSQHQNQQNNSPNKHLRKTTKRYVANIKYNTHTHKHDRTCYTKHN